MIKQYKPEVVRIGGANIETKMVQEFGGEYVRYSDYADLAEAARDFVLDLDHAGLHPVGKSKLEKVLDRLGEL